MKKNTRVGLLPLYLELYDKIEPASRQQFARFLATVTEAFTAAGIGVVEGGICCVEAEVQQAVEAFEQAGVDLIVVVHLAYSPSLESAGALAGTAIPILLLDTTMDYRFGPDVGVERIAYNHGIHGVQDLASVLYRRGRAYAIVAGHVTESCVLSRACGMARAAHAARLFRESRVLRVGASFEGMGDFAVSDSVMQEVLGICVDQIDREDLASEVVQVRSADVEAEARTDRECFDAVLAEEVHRRSLRVSLGLRRLLERGAYTAFSMNFLAFDSNAGPTDTVPFLEASKAMERGMGYAGEGDVLTASLVGALTGAFERATFTEIFCPDWEGGSLFLSHMGEINPKVAGATPELVEMEFPYTAAKNPAILACGLAEGPATLVNLAPGPEGRFGLITSRVDVLGDATNPGLRRCIRGWIRPTVPLESFLEHYSRLGGTHHSALVYGDCVEAMQAFGAFTGLPVRVI